VRLGESVKDYSSNESGDQIDHNVPLALAKQNLRSCNTVISLTVAFASFSFLNRTNRNLLIAILLAVSPTSFTVERSPVER
jgi:hypothetical protein